MKRIFYICLLVLSFVLAFNKASAEEEKGQMILEIEVTDEELQAYAEQYKSDSVGVDVFVESIDTGEVYSLPILKDNNFREIYELPYGDYRVVKPTNIEVGMYYVEAVDGAFTVNETNNIVTPQLRLTTLEEEVATETKEPQEEKMEESEEKEKDKGVRIPFGTFFTVAVIIFGIGLVGYRYIKELKEG